MADIPQIITSGSAYGSWLRCNRLRYWSYEHLNQDGTRGLERKSLSLPLSTGTWCHKIAQGLFGGGNATEQILDAKQGYLDEVRNRGLELGLSLDGAIPEEQFTERTITEQAALIEAFGWAFARVRLPKLLDEYELLDVEREEYTLLSGDVALQSRCDAILKRKSDGYLFIYNLKTASSCDKKWADTFQYDQQLMTETLAVERRLGERVYGVIIDGFEKGQRVPVWWHNLKELRDGVSKPPPQGDEKWQAQRSRLLYGYKCEETVPGRPTLYDYEGTTRKGWEKFAVFEEQFNTPITDVAHWGISSSIAYWINWLPIEQVESVFHTLPPIMRSDEHVNAKVRQIVEVEQDIRRRRDLCVDDIASRSLDRYFPQSDGYQCQWCAFKQKCWESNSDDLYQPRNPNHPSLESE